MNGERERMRDEFRMLGKIMKFLAVLCGLAVWVGAARAGILFEGYMSTSKQTLFVLSVDKKTSSGWLAIGQSFESFVITGFDAKAEALTIEKDGESRVLRLVSGKVVAGENTPDEIVRPISILLPDGWITVRDDEIMMAALKSKLRQFAKEDPQLSVALVVPDEAPKEMIKRIYDVVRVAGVWSIDIISLDKKD